MLKHLASLIACALAAAGFALIAPASPAHALGDMDCSDFGSQAAAQKYFLSKGGPQSDPDDLDSDGDGIACESNPCPCSTAQSSGGGGDTKGDGGTKSSGTKKKRSYFGSIALNPTTGWAWLANNAKSKRAAVNGAASTCRRHKSPRSCRSAGWVRNGCIATAYRVVDGDTVAIRTAKANTLKRARAFARAKLSGPAGQKRIWASLCTKRHG